MELLQRESAEIRCVTFCVERPCIWLAICYVIMIVLSGVTIGTGMIELTNGSNRDWLVWDDPIIVTNDKKNLAD